MKHSLFRDQVALVTGGSSGIGKQIARDLLDRGAYVTIISDDRRRLNRAYSQLSKVSANIDIEVCDVRIQERLDEMAQRVLRKHGHVDVLINNAGYAIYRSFEESSVEEVLDILDVNLCGAMRCTKAFLPSMIMRREGRIVNISSIAGELIITPNAAYCAAKHGMVAWSRAIRLELARFNIAVNVVCPGRTGTSFHDHPSFRRRDVYRRKSTRSLSVEKVSLEVLNAIRRDRAVAYVPRKIGAIVWALNALPHVTRPIWDRIMHRRIDQLYEQIWIEEQGYDSSIR